MRLAIGYSTKDQVELTRQTLPRVLDRGIDLYWCDGSRTDEGRDFFEQHPWGARNVGCCRVVGGADAGIAWKLYRLLASNATHIMLLENDVLLDEDWFEPTMALFEKGEADGLHVGAVSPRSYVDRVLVQRDGYAVMHNIGAGAIVFTREAAQIVLETFRTGWWPSVRYAFGNVCGVDIGAYACFGGNAQNVTTDWQFEYQMLRRGLVALALTPAKCQMIGQNPPLAEQGLELTTGPVEARVNDEAFRNLRMMTHDIRVGRIDANALILRNHQQFGQTLFYPHQVGQLFAQLQGWRLKWTQGHGPFSYVAGPGGASLSVRVAGSCSFLLSGGADCAVNVKVVDTHSGFRSEPRLPPFQGQFTEVTVPGGCLPRTIAVGLSEGGIFYGVNCADPQVTNAAYAFDWTHLPEPE